MSGTVKTLSRGTTLNPHKEPQKALLVHIFKSGNPAQRA